MQPCSQDTANDHHTRQGAHRDTLHHGLSFKENILPLFATASTPHSTASTFFFSGKNVRPPLTLFKKKELYFSPLILLVSPSCLEDSRGHWDSRLWYGLKTSVMFRGGGTRCSALHGNQMKALSVELNLHSKSPYGADYHTWERER